MAETKTDMEIRFMYPNPDLQEHYATNFGLRTISEGRTFKLEEFSMIKCLKEAVEFQGWKYFLGISEEVYHGVVRAFYSQLKTSDSSSTFTHLSSIIRDMELEIRPSDLAKVTKSPYEGHICSPHDGWWKQMKVTEGQISEALTGSSSMRVRAIKTSNLTPEARGIYHLVQHTILPRSGSTDVLMGLDFMLLYCLVKKLKVNLPRLIMDYMASTVSKEKKSHAALPYGMLLTKVFKQVGFSLDSEEKKGKGKTFTMVSFRNLLTAKQEKKAGKAPAEPVKKRKMILPESNSEESSSSSRESTSEDDAIKAEPLRAGKARAQKKRKQAEEEKGQTDTEKEDDDTIISFKRRDKLPIRRKKPSPPPQPKYQPLAASIRLAEKLFDLATKSSSSEKSDTESEDADVEEAKKQSLHQKDLEQLELERQREIARGAQSSSGAAPQLTEKAGSSKPTQFGYTSFPVSGASASPSLQQIYSAQGQHSEEMADIGPEEVQASRTIAAISLQAKYEVERLMAAEQQAKAEAERLAAKAKIETNQARLVADQSDGDHTAATHSEDEIQGHIAGLRSAMQPDESQGLNLEPESDLLSEEQQQQQQPQEAVAPSALIPFVPPPQIPASQPQPPTQSTSPQPSTQLLMIHYHPPPTTSHPASSPAPPPSAEPNPPPPPAVPNSPATTSSAQSPAELQLLFQNIHDLASRMDRVEASNRDLAAHLRAQDQLMLQMMQMLRDMQNRGQ